MPTSCNGSEHVVQNAFGFLNARDREGLVFAGRRGMLKAGLAGMAGLTLPDLLRARSKAAVRTRRARKTARA